MVPLIKEVAVAWMISLFDQITSSGVVGSLLPSYLCGYLLLILPIRE